MLLRTIKVTIFFILSIPSLIIAKPINFEVLTDGPGKNNAENDQTGGGNGGGSSCVCN